MTGLMWHCGMNVIVDDEGDESLVAAFPDATAVAVAVAVAAASNCRADVQHFARKGQQ